MMPLIRKFVRETVLYGFDKDDLMQECYMQLQKALERYNEALGVPFESYYRVSLYGWRSNENKKSMRRLSKEQDPIMEIVDERMSVANEVEMKLLWEMAQGEIEMLSEVEQLILRQYYLEHMPLVEIAKSLGISYKTLESKKGAILKKLRKRMC